MKNRICVFIASHSKPKNPIKKLGYKYISVGGHYVDTFNDNIPQNDNISDKNKFYCELTATYWIWKNYNADYVGLVHYRRFLRKKHSYLIEKAINRFNIFDGLLCPASSFLFVRLLRKYDVILPNKISFNNLTIKEQYQSSHGGDDLDIVRSVLQRKYPDAVEIFDWLLCENSFHHCNIIITKKSIFDDYSSFLFDILFECEKTIGNKPRVYGFISERLMDVFLKLRQLSYIELPLYRRNK